MKLNSALIQPQRPLLSAPVPLAFNFNATSRRPLIPLTAVAFLLDKTHAQVIELIEEGKIRWAFDIRSSGKTHREIRVLRHSLLQLIGFHAPADSPIAEDFPADDAREFDEIIKLILPPGFVLSPATLSGRPAAAPSKPTLSARLLSLSIRSNSVSPTSLFPQEPVLRGTEIAQSVHVHQPACPQSAAPEFAARRQLAPLAQGHPVCAAFQRGGISPRPADSIMFCLQTVFAGRNVPFGPMVLRISISADPAIT